MAPKLSVDDPASQPYVLAVGGTSLSAGAAGGQAAWTGSGGGLSATWTSPGWQVDSGVPGLDDPSVIADAAKVGRHDLCASPSTCREVPDVAALADPAAGAITVYHDGAWTSDGGTSSAAPLWAAMLTDTASTTACLSDGRPGGGLGFVPPLLYRVAADPATYAGAFDDITTGSDAIVAGSKGLYPATAGYDMVTGLGTPILSGAGGTPGLAAALCAAAEPSAPTVDGVSPSHAARARPGRTGGPGRDRHRQRIRHAVRSGRRGVRDGRHRRDPGRTGTFAGSDRGRTGPAHRAGSERRRSGTGRDRRSRRG